MKLKRLLSLAMLCIVGMTSAWAQYTTGSTVAAGSDYFLYNIAAQKFLTNGMDWGTHATVDNAGRVITFAALADGKYSIYTKNYSSDDRQGYMTTNGYIDTGTNDANWIFTPVSVGGYTNAYTIKNSDTQYLYYDVADSRVQVGEATNTNADYWIIVPKSVRDAAGEMTYLLQNTDFNRPWELFIWSGTAPTAQAGGLPTNRVAEMFDKTFDIYQQVSSVPNGRWTLTCQGYYRAGGKDNSAIDTKNAKLYINNTEAPLMNILEGATPTNTTGWDYQNAKGYIPDNLNEVSTHFSNGDYSSNTVTAVVTDGTLKLGVKSSAKVDNDWTTFDNFKLYYAPIPLDYSELAGTVKKAQAINAIINNDALATAISNAQAELSDPTAEYQDAIDALTTAINNALPTIQQSENLDSNTGWTLSSNGSYDYKAFANYGSETNVNNAPIPATDMYGKSEGGAVGMSSGWNNAATISKTISNLPAGEYILYYEAYNGGTSAGTGITESKTSLGTAFDGKDATTSYTLNTWNVIAKKIVIHEQGDQTLTLGFNNDASSNNTAKLWIDNLTIFSTPNLILPAETAIENNAQFYMKSTNNQYLDGNGSNEGVTDASGKVITFVNTGANETMLKFDDKYIIANGEDGQSAGNWGIYTNGTNPPANTATHSLYWVATAKDGGYTFKDTKYGMYLAADNNGNVMKSSSEYVWKFVSEEDRAMVPGMDMTGKIANPGFELGNTDGWTVTPSTDTGAKSTTNDTYKALGSEGNYLFNNYWQGTPLTQNIGKLPAGIYQLSAMLASGDTPTNRGITFLTVNDAHSQGRLSRNGEKRVMGKETMTFVSDGTSEITIGAVGGSDEASGSEFREDGYFWYKADDFHLTYINTTDELFNEFTKVLNACKPWVGSTKDADYVTAYNTYSSYTDATPQADLLAAINYMNTKYDVYAWDNASAEHPYLMPNYVFGFDNTCKTNDGTTGSGRSMPSTTRPDGSTGLVWSANGTGCTRSSSMTLPYQGIYKLQAKVKKVVNETHHVDITIDGETTVNNDLTKDVWTDMDIILGNVDYKESNIKVFISSTNGKQDYVFVGGIDLYYTGMQGDFVKGDTHYYYGNYATVEATDEVPVVDATLATGVTTFTRTNPNGLCYVANDATLTGDNVVKGETCATLVLTDGHPFKAIKNFTAANASYEMTAIAGDKFGTLMLPFAVSTIPNSGKAYILDQGVSFGDEIHATEANAIVANTPVLVTAAGTYSANSVAVAATNDTYTNGELVGTYKATPAIANTYILQNHSGRVAFFMVNTAGVTTVNPFRAYIKAQNAGARDFLNVVFDDETGLDMVNESTSQQVNQIYDLSGRRVNNAVKGIYIINGKKVIK